MRKNKADRLAVLLFREICGEETSMEYIIATENDAEEILAIVQDTICTIYPRYYPRKVVDFFVPFIAGKI